VKLRTLGRRYALALLNLAVEQNALDDVRRSLREFATTFEQNRDLRAVFENPSVSFEARRAILRDIAQASGMHKLVLDALLFVSDRGGRFKHLPEIVDAFEAAAEARAGRVRAEVVTATELPEEYFAGLQRTLEQVTGKQVVVVRRVDPSIIGGVVTRVGDKVFDGSVQHQLNELKEELTRGPSVR
jgi:F-type H+-transporting ATPase subunit delta